MRKRLTGIFGPGFHTIVNGACKGADLLSSEIGKEHSWKVIEVPAEWNKYGRAAGPIRNKKMLTDNPDLDGLIAFTNDLKKSKGTRDMVFQANKKGLAVILIPDKDDSLAEEQEEELTKQLVKVQKDGKEE